MKIVLDTNVFVADLTMRGTSFRVLQEALDRAGYSLHIPAVVVAEVQNKYREQLAKAVNQLEGTYRQLDRLGAQVAKPTVTPDWQNDQGRLYDDHVSRWLRDRHAEVLPIPDISHEELLSRELSRRKPFSTSGAGYRDALIWESIVLLAERGGVEGDAEVLFVSANTQDFGSEGELHADLIQDLDQRGIDTRRIYLATGLDKLIERWIKPDFERLESIREALRSGTWENISLRGSLDSVVPRLAEERDWRARELGLPEDASRIQVVRTAGEVGDIDVTDVLKLPDGELYIEADAEIDLQVSFETTERWRPYGSDWETDELGYYDEFPQPIRAHASRTMRLALFLTVDPENGDVTSVETDYAERMA